MPTPTFALISVHQLRPTTDPAQRPVDKTTDDIAELADSIVEVGLLEPLLVRPAGDADDEYVLVAGHRRLAALNLLLDRADAGTLTAQLPELVDGVPCLIRTGVSGAGTDTVAALVENLQRVNLTPLQEATALRVLRDDHGWTQAAIASAIGRNQGHVSKRLTLLRLTPPLLGLLEAGRLTVETGVDVARLPKAAQDAVHALIEQGQAPERAYTVTRRRFAELSDRTKVLRGLAAGDFPHLAGVPYVDDADPSRDVARLHGYGYPGSVVARDAHGYLAPLLAAGVPADQIAVVVADRPSNGYTVGDLEQAVDAWTRVLVSETARNDLRDARDAAGAPPIGPGADWRAPASDGLGALIPPRTEAEPLVQADPADLPSASAADVDDAAAVLVDPLPAVTTDVDPDDDVLDELDDEGIGTDTDAALPEQWDPADLLETALDYLNLALTEYTGPNPLDGDARLYAAQAQQALVNAVARLTAYDPSVMVMAPQEADAFISGATTALAAASAALDLDQYAPDAQPTSTSAALQVDAEEGPTTPDSDPDDRDGAASSVRSEGNAGERLVVDRSARVSELRAWLRSVGVSEYDGRALQALRRADLMAAVDAYNAGLAEADGGA